MSVLLKTDGLTKRFGGLTAVNDVSLEVREGEVLGLLGPNGSGKTTLLNLLSGALRPSAGQFAVEGRQLAGARPDVIAGAGVARTFQLVRILPSLSLEENVMVPAAFGAKRLWVAELAARVRECLAMVGLEDRAAGAAADLTYIDQKRLELARALAAEPRILLLDEWLAGLNPTELHEGIALIRRLEETGITIIMVEHIMDAVRALCPRCAVMNSGALIADGPTAEVLDDPHVVAAYLGEEDA
ncbi:ABC transporter ATP-binding protein [Phycobacter azelaicus]|uniref:ABC transporter ATP-binding protein n=1 Tax=Phycobacter azelaicus TaxID=2668075 RepID=UPI0018684514|nr:ABC transporter ATP-binding protein [Phycobacter azelaicus]MBE1296677.1 ATP-binding cassette domain-containing protein [Paracoccaceae bacterium]